MFYSIHDSFPPINWFPTKYFYIQKKTTKILIFIKTKGMPKIIVAHFIIQSRNKENKLKWLTQTVLAQSAFPSQPYKRYFKTISPFSISKTSLYVRVAPRSSNEYSF